MRMHCEASMGCYALSNKVLHLLRLHVLKATSCMPSRYTMHASGLVASGGAAGVNVSQSNLLASCHCCFLHFLNAGLVLCAGFYHLAPSGACTLSSLQIPAFLRCSVSIKR